MLARGERSLAALSSELGVSQQTLRTWRKQAGVVATICRVLEVSRSGYYAWAARGPSTRALADVAMAERIREIHCESDGTYGSRRVHAQLSREGVEINIP